MIKFLIYLVLGFLLFFVLALIPESEPKPNIVPEEPIEVLKKELESKGLFVNEKSDAGENTPLVVVFAEVKPSTNITAQTIRNATTEAIENCYDFLGFKTVYLERDTTALPISNALSPPLVNDQEDEYSWLFTHPEFKTIEINNLENISRMKSAEFIFKALEKPDSDWDGWIFELVQERSKEVASKIVSEAKQEKEKKPAIILVIPATYLRQNGGIQSYLREAEISFVVCWPSF